jgi:hypothetical protein
MNNQNEQKTHDHEKADLIIILNGRETTVEEKKLSYEQIIILALKEYTPAENVSYSVTCSKGEHANDEGIIIPGQVVKVKKGMVLNVTKTTRS